MPRRPEPRASPCLRLALSVAVLAASLTSRPAGAEPAISATADEHYERGRSEREAKRFAAAVAEFAIAYKEIPPTQSQRATVLFELVDAQRSAFAAGGRVRGREHPAKHLCDAEVALTEFIEMAEKKRAPKAKRSPDARMAGELRVDVRKQLDEARKASADLDCATVELPRDDVPEPAPEALSNETDKPRRAIHKPFVIAGAVTTGVGMIFVGLLASGLVRGKRAEEDGDALVAKSPTLPEEDPVLKAIDRRGKSANHLAIAGGVIGTAALGAGIALLVIGLRGGPSSSRVALSPTFSRQDLGLLLRWQF
ncbi:MAG: hypothetical protein H0T76_20715 [Nannocystis sp.]|nr:hypothetical protein [Nannocystis sp.]MBA3548912.1 hypothetical protein [Nannocystis sp.]